MSCRFRSLLGALGPGAEKRASAFCRASSAGLMKLAFSRNAFVQFTGMFDVIFKFTVPLRQLRGHHVNSRRRIVPAGWSISDRLAEVELMGHVARPEAYDPFKDCPMRRHIKAGW